MTPADDKRNEIDELTAEIKKTIADLAILMTEADSKHGIDVEFKIDRVDGKFAAANVKVRKNL